jgi:protein-disulfide isomerase
MASPHWRRARSSGALLGVLPFLAVLLIGGGAAPAQSPSQEQEFTPRRVQMKLAGLEYALGAPGAPVTLVEFTDYQCPFCRRFQAQDWPQLKRDYIDTGKVRFIVRDLPLSFHSNARPAAEAAHCAGEQSRFWPMHLGLLGQSADLSPQGLEARARALGLDLPRFRACIAANKYEGAIAANAAQADVLGIRGTPAFVVGAAQHGQLDGVLLEGALPYDTFRMVLEALLAGG